MSLASAGGPLALGAAWPAGDLGDVLVQYRQGQVSQHGGEHAPNAMDNFCFEVTLSYRRLERPRRATGSK